MHEIRSAIRSGDQAPRLVASKARKGDRPAAGLAAVAIKRLEARVTDQRLEDRKRDMFEQATIIFRRKKFAVAVINVSSRGAMLGTDLDPRIGEKIDILFTPENKTRCAVRWVREGRVGVEFLNETIFWEAPGNGPVFRNDAAANEQTERDSGADAGPRSINDRAPRQRLLRSGTLYWGGVSIPVRLRNISPGGASLDSERLLQQGCAVDLDLGQAGHKAAEIRWSKEGQVGLRFLEEFDLDSLAPSEPTAEGRAEVLKPAYLETELQPDSPWAARFERLSLSDVSRVRND